MKLYAKYYKVTAHEYINSNEHYTLPEVTIMVPEEEYEKDPERYEEEAEKQFAEKNNFTGWFDTEVEEEFVEVK